MNNVLEQQKMFLIGQALEKYCAPSDPHDECLRYSNVSVQKGGDGGGQQEISFKMNEGIKFNLLCKESQNKISCDLFKQFKVMKAGCGCDPGLTPSMYVDGGFTDTGIDVEIKGEQKTSDVNVQQDFLEKSDVSDVFSDGTNDIYDPDIYQYLDSSIEDNLDSHAIDADLSDLALQKDNEDDIDVTGVLTDVQADNDEKDTINNTDIYEDNCVGVNHPPVLELIGDKTLIAGAVLTFSLYVTDPDICDIVSFQGNYLPFGSKLDQISGEFDWTPQLSQYGNYKVQFCATDGMLSDCEMINIHVEQNCDAQIISKTSDGKKVWTGWDPTINNDGSKVVYAGPASAITNNPSDKVTSILLYNAKDGSTNIISMQNNGAVPNGNSRSPSISADGNVIAFVSDATNLDPLVQSGGVFVYDSISKKIVNIIDDKQGLPLVSPDGRYVAFSSDRSNIVPYDQNGKSDIFLYDRQTKNVQLLSLDPKGYQGMGSYLGGISSNISKAYFTMWVADPGYGPVKHIYSRDHIAGTTTQVSTNSGANDVSMIPSDHGVANNYFIHSGQYCFSQLGGKPGICVNDYLVSYAENGYAIQHGLSMSEYSISASARFALFEVSAPQTTLYARDLQKNNTRVIEQDVAGGSSFNAMISGDGKMVTYVKPIWDSEKTTYAVMLRSLECFFPIN